MIISIILDLVPYEVIPSGGHAFSDHIDWDSLHENLKQWGFLLFVANIVA